MDVQQLQEITRLYARYRRNAAGLGNVIGGAFVIVTYVASILLPLALWGRILIACSPIVWILAKELLRRRYYQRHGAVTESTPVTDRRWHVFRTGSVAMVSLLVVGVVAWKLAGSGLNGVPLGAAAGYLGFIAAMPLLVWFAMPTVEEFLVGVFLVCQAAVIIAGGHYGLLHVYAPVFGLLAVMVGFKQHAEYLRVDRQLAAIEQAS